MIAEKKTKINKRRLIRELLIIGGVALVVFLVRFLPWLAEQPIPGYDPYAKYQTLFKAVSEHDYSGKRDSALELRLDNATTSVGDEPVKYYFNLKAKVYYYSKVGLYMYSNQIADKTMSFVPTSEEMMFMYGMYIENYRGLRNEKKVLEYEELYNEVAETIE